MKTTSKNMIQSRGQGAHPDNVAHQKIGKKEARAEEKLTQPTKTVQYDKILVTGVTDLFFLGGNGRLHGQWCRLHHVII
jgi:hypothetical protein